MNAVWRFSDPKNLAVISLRQILVGDSPILHVVRGLDGSWQFLSGELTNIEDAVVVSLSAIVELDPSVIRLAELPIGRQASRLAPFREWTIDRNENLE